MIFGRKKNKREDADDDDEEQIELISFLGPLSGDPPDLQQNAGLVRAGLIPAKELISDAISRRAHTFRLEPKGNAAIGMLQVDGMPFAGPRMPAKQGLAITQMLKLLSGLNIQERGKPQRGGIKAEYGKVPYEITIDITPTSAGERLSIYMDNLKERPQTPEEIGIPEPLRDKIRSKTSTKTGVLLCCGPPRSGVTTTTVGAVRCIDAYIYTIFTLFDTGSWEIPYVTRFEQKEATDNFETTIIRCQRVDGQVLYTQPLKTPEDMRTVFDNAERCAYVAEYPAKDTISGLLQLLEWVGNADLVCNHLHGLLTQKLIRKLCRKCKQAYPPNPKLLARLGLEPGSIKALYRHRVPPQQLAKGEEWEVCRICGDLGYIGRTAMFEYLEMTDGLREVLKSNPTSDAIKAQMKKDNMVTLQQDGLRLVKEGITSLEELQRVFKS
ncbi:MAG TPA: ATPase, T2SS/T4P/T4SS family [Planctomycetaceae bacterium]|nr:ATPase, T2SS/T4P/T4SS family [Planctomycetaceae bacterium]